MNEVELEEIKKILDAIPDKFRIIEENIKPEMVEEFLTKSELIETLNINEEIKILDFENEWETLKSKEELKILLIQLSRIGTISSYRQIEKIVVESKDKGIIDFGHVALSYNRVTLESELLEEPIGFISTGLGGEGNKLRYYFVVKSIQKISQEKEKQILREMKLVCRKRQSEFRAIENYGKYVLIKILVSIEEAIGIVIEDIINKCEFLDKEYMCTNVEKPEEEFINKWINGEIE